jgi:flagellar biosynthetic protein FlhB
VADEKPFDPTPARLARARREGDVPRSRDVAATASFAFAGAALAATRDAIANASSAMLVSAAHGGVAFGAYALLAGCACVVCASGIVGGVGASVVQAGSIAFRMPTLDPKKLDPVAGFKRLVGRDAAIGAVKAIVLASAVGAALWPALRDAFAAGSTYAAALAQRTFAAIALAFVAATGVAALFAAVDAIVEREKWRRRLRMSFEEIKRDHKSSEGDPHLRGRRRRAHRDLVRGSIARVADAAFVVANPTHVAIALEYAPPAVAVPRVLVRAIDAGALAVRERARALDVPIVEDVRLARALLATTDVGDPIPRDEYGAVALIVATLTRARVRRT